MDKSIRLACAVIILLFVSGSIVVAEQTKFGNKTYTAASPNENSKPLNHTINPVHLLPGQMLLPGGHVVNISDQEKNVIRRWTVNFRMPKTDSVKEHVNATILST